MTKWTDEQVETLRALWGNTYAVDIGEKIGRPKNAVIGKANRLGLEQLRNTPHRDQPIKIRVPKPTTKRVTIPTFRFKPVKNIPLVAPLNIGFMELTPTTCRNMSEGEGYQGLYCGNFAPDGKFCGQCSRVLYIPENERRKNATDKRGFRFPTQNGRVRQGYGATTSPER